MSILLRLLFAHIVADFFLQTKWMVEGKENGGKRSMMVLTLHSLIHSLMAYLMVGEWTSWYIAIVIFVTHFFIDWCKIILHGNSVSAFLIDQISAKNGRYPPTQNGDIRSLLALFRQKSLQN